MLVAPVLYGVVAEHLETLLEATRADPDRNGLPRRNVHFHLLVLDGVDTRDDTGGLTFTELRRPRATPSSA